MDVNIAIQPIAQPVTQAIYSFQLNAVQYQLPFYKEIIANLNVIPHFILKIIFVTVIFYKLSKSLLLRLLFLF